MQFKDGNKGITNQLGDFYTATDGANKIRKVILWVSEVERKVSNMEDRVNKLVSVNSKCLNEVKQQRMKVDELDNKSRRNNLCLLGLPEGEERTRTEKLIGSLF